MVAVSAGDSLETIMAAHGSGAVARSRRERATVMNIDIGGGTSKIAICAEGKVVAQTAVDVGARLISWGYFRACRTRGAAGSLPGRRFPGLRAHSRIRGCDGGPSRRGHSGNLGRIADRRGHGLRRRCRIFLRPGAIGFWRSGDVAGSRDSRTAGSMGSAYRMPGSGNPRNRDWRVAIHYAGQWQHHLCFAARYSAAAQRRGNCAGPRTESRNHRFQRSLRGYPDSASYFSIWPMAIFPSRYSRRGVARQPSPDSTRSAVAFAMDSQPCSTGAILVLAGDGDVGGLIGVHFHEELGMPHAVVSIDSLELREFDYIDIGAMLDLSGAVPVVIKSLLFGRRAS